MHDYDRRDKAAQIKAAGRSFKQHHNQLEMALGKAHEATRGADGLIHYRLYDRQGSRRDPLSPEPFLDDHEKREAETIRANLLACQKAIEGAIEKMKEFERDVPWLDKNLGYH